jgi:hypothetical protein
VFLTLFFPHATTFFGKKMRKSCACYPQHIPKIANIGQIGFFQVIHTQAHLLRSISSRILCWYEGHRAKIGLLSSLTFALSSNRDTRINALAARTRLKPSNASQVPLPPPPIFAEQDWRLEVGQLDLSMVLLDFLSVLLARFPLSPIKVS